MKRCIALLTPIIIGGTVALGNVNQHSNQVLVASVIRKVGGEAINAFPDPAPILGLLETSPDFARLCETAEESWSQSIAELATNSLDRASRLVLLHSYLYLPPKAYMRCLEQVLDLFQQGHVQRDELVHIFILPPRDENRWFLSHNAEQPQMVRFLARVRSAFEGDSQIKHIIDLIAEGKARIRDERLRGEKVSLSKRKVPHLPNE